MNNYTDITITCPFHGDFVVRPSSFLAGYACKFCSKYRYTTDTFVQQANTVHANKYNYSKFIYTNSTTKSIIICPIHGEFSQSPANHLIGNGCKICSHEKLRKERQLTLEEFINKANIVHKNKYCYEKVVYINNRTPIVITCPEHGEFLQVPSDHLSGYGCTKCAGKFISDTPSFIARAKELGYINYDYSKVEYIKSSKKITVICPKHGEFLVTPNGFIGGHGCPKCASSKGESFIREYLKTHQIRYKEQFRIPECKNIKPLPFDFAILNSDETIMLLIEYDGEFHYKEAPSTMHRSDLASVQYRDGIKTKYCEANNIPLLRIKYTDFNNIASILDGTLKQHHLYIEGGK